MDPQLEMAKFASKTRDEEEAARVEEEDDGSDSDSDYVVENHLRFKRVPEKEPQWDVDSYDGRDYESDPEYHNFYPDEDDYKEFRRLRIETLACKGFSPDYLLGIYPFGCLDYPLGNNRTNRDLLTELASLCVKKLNEDKGKAVELDSIVSATVSGGARWKIYITFMAREYQNGPLVEYQAKVMRYFPAVNFLESIVGARSSFAWRSIQWGRELLVKGLRKRVGNGNTIKKWDVAKLREVFFEEDVQRVMEFQPVTNVEDFWCWMHNQSGDYSVKSGFWLATSINKAESIREASLLPSLNALKAAVWIIPTTQKIRNFLWRALSGAVAVGDKLREREMGFSESIYTNINFLLEQRKNDLIPQLLRRRFPWVIWFLWKKRNNLAFESKNFNAMITMEKIIEEVDQWFVAQEIDKVLEDMAPVVSTTQVKRWRPPPEPWLKCNVGVYTEKGSRTGGVAWVLRDWKGVVCLHSRRAFASVGNKLECGFVGALWALESLRSHGVKRVVLALEDSVVLGVMDRPKAWPSFKLQVGLFSTVIPWFDDLKYELEPRCANRGAYLIAQSVVRGERGHSYVASGHPRWLNGIFDNERVPSSV
ncbi:unnamed protein product [Microthlaspi erraticum]|uniref:RNase H type-1 domain-containing protein n=1 Tax=Microthlaspi erraticum TaxID=1685480 RepID=A0A6D2IRG7_9BRAS|nr:unnamed protein product [Microthlaspi erraticum]